MYCSEDLLMMVNRELDAMPYDRHPQRLYAPIRYVLSIGGKRIRPVLMLMAYNMYKDDVEHIMRQAIGLETYHNFTLLHDDLMDRAEVRRGMPCVHKKWDDNTAILSGDNMLVLAYHHLLQCDDDKLPFVMRLFTETALQIDEGQQYDVDFETRNDVEEEEYIEMIRLKTSVLLACACKMGALLAGATPEDADALYHFGESIGLAFQLQDDYLDVYGDYKVFGKRIGGDILCNKKTFMLINALLLSNEIQRKELEKWLSATDYVEDEKVQAVTSIYTEVGVDKLAQQRIDEYFAQAKEWLDKVNLPSSQKEPLWQLALQMMHRKS